MRFLVERVEKEEVVRTLRDLTQIRDENNQLIPSYCFIEEFEDIYRFKENEAIQFALDNGFKVYRTIPTEEIDENIIIANKDCPLNVIIDNFKTFFEITVDIEEIEEI